MAVWNSETRMALEVYKNECLAAIADIRGTDKNIKDPCPALMKMKSGGDCGLPEAMRAHGRGVIALLRAQVANIEAVQEAARVTRSAALSLTLSALKWGAVVLTSGALALFGMECQLHRRGGASALPPVHGAEAPVQPTGK